MIKKSKPKSTEWIKVKTIRWGVWSKVEHFRKSGLDSEMWCKKRKPKSIDWIKVKMDYGFQN